MDDDDGSPHTKRDYEAYKMRKRVKIAVMDTPPLLTKTKIDSVVRDPYQSKVRRQTSTPFPRPFTAPRSLSLSLSHPLPPLPHSLDLARKENQPELRL